MRFLVLGGGAQGSAAAYDLLQDSRVERVVLADRRTDPVPSFLTPFLGDRLERRELAADSEAGVRAAMAGQEAVLCALPYHWNERVARLAVDSGIHFTDLGGNTEIVEKQRALDRQARDAGVSVVPDCGLAPGLVNILAQGGINRMESTDHVRMWVGGLPQTPVPPLNYQLVYSLEGVLDYYTTPGVILRDGEPVEVDPLTGLEDVEFPEPVGVLEAFFTAGGASTLPRRYRGKVRSLEYRTLRYPGHAALMRALRQLGLFSKEPIEVEGTRVTPRKLFVAAATPALRAGDGRDLVVLRVEVRGVAGGKTAGVRYELTERYDEAVGMTAMTRVTGCSLALVALMQAEARVLGAGVRTPDEAVNPELFIRELGERGIQIHMEAL